MGWFLKQVFHITLASAHSKLVGASSSSPTLVCMWIPYICRMLLLRCCCTKAMPIGPYRDYSIWAVHPVQLKLGQSHWRLCCLIKHFLITDTVARFSRGLQTWLVTWGRTLESSPIGITPLTPVCAVAKLWGPFQCRHFLSIKPGNSTSLLDQLQPFLLSFGPTIALWCQSFVLILGVGAAEGGRVLVLVKFFWLGQLPKSCLCWQGGWHCWTSVIEDVQ